MAIFDEAWRKRAGKRAGKGAAYGSTAGAIIGGAPTGGVLAIPGAAIGGVIGATAGLLGGNETSPKPGGPSEQQRRDAALEDRLRREAWRAADQMRGAAARDESRRLALGYDPSLAMLQDVGSGVETALAGTDVERAIFKQETSDVARREARLVWLMQQAESLRAAGRHTAEELEGLRSAIGSDQVLHDTLNRMIAGAEGKPTFGGDVAGYLGYFTGIGQG